MVILGQALLKVLRDEEQFILEYHPLKLDVTHKMGSARALRKNAK
jgi:hypothetical protein